MSVEPPVNKAANEAVIDAMCRLTFGIVGDGTNRQEGQGLGSGIGILWNRRYLIATAAHVVETTRDERRYFFLPGDHVALPESDIYASKAAPRLSPRVQVERSNILLDDSEDLAFVLLPEQKGDVAANHFYALAEGETAPQYILQAGVFGYPAAVKQPVGNVFAAAPYAAFGELITDSNGDSSSQVALSYAKEDMDPRGFSGAGIWSFQDDQQLVWSPQICLVGLVTHFDPEIQALTGVPVEKLIERLISNEI